MKRDHLEGRNALSRAEAIKAKCWECCGHYVDGKNDCGVRGCPLYAFMPFRQLDPDLSWKNFDPRRAGLVPWAIARARYTEEERRRRGATLCAARRARLERERQTP